MLLLRRDIGIWTSFRIFSGYTEKIIFVTLEWITVLLFSLLVYCPVVHIHTVHTALWLSIPSKAVEGTFVPNIRLYFTVFTKFSEWICVHCGMEQEYSKRNCGHSQNTQNYVCESLNRFELCICGIHRKKLRIHLVHGRKLFFLHHTLKWLEFRWICENKTKIENILGG